MFHGLWWTLINRILFWSINCNILLSSLFDIHQSSFVLFRQMFRSLYVPLNEGSLELCQQFLYIYRVSQKKVWFAEPGAKLFLFCVQLSCIVFFQYFWKIVIFFGTSMAQKKSSNLFFSQNLKFRKQKCVNKLFISKSKILKRLNHKISENLQNCN